MLITAEFAHGGSMGKTPFVSLKPEVTQAANPFTRMRWYLNQVEGKWDMVTRMFMAIQRAATAEEAKNLATEALNLMSRTEIKA
jgi:hypothetical protein